MCLLSHPGEAVKTFDAISGTRGIVDVRQLSCNVEAPFVDWTCPSLMQWNDTGHVLESYFCVPQFPEVSHSSGHVSQCPHACGHVRFQKLLFGAAISTARVLGRSQS
jgi:hypothetical protein